MSRLLDHTAVLEQVYTPVPGTLLAAEATDRSCCPLPATFRMAAIRAGTTCYREDGTHIIPRSRARCTYLVAAVSGLWIVKKTKRKTTTKRALVTRDESDSIRSRARTRVYEQSYYFILLRPLLWSATAAASNALVCKAYRPTDRYLPILIDTPRHADSRQAVISHLSPVTRHVRFIGNVSPEKHPILQSLKTSEYNVLYDRTPKNRTPVLYRYFDRLQNPRPEKRWAKAPPG